MFFPGYFLAASSLHSTKRVSTLSVYRCKKLSINDIATEPFVLTEHGQGYRRVFDREMAKRSIDITPILEISNISKKRNFPIKKRAEAMLRLSF